MFKDTVQANVTVTKDSRDPQLLVESVDSVRSFAIGFDQKTKLS